MKAQGLWNKYDAIIKFRPDCVLNRMINISDYVVKDTLCIPISKERSQWGILYNDLFAFSSPVVMEKYFRDFELYDVFHRIDIKQVLNYDGYGSTHKNNFGPELLLEMIFCQDETVKLHDLYDDDVTINIIR